RENAAGDHPWIDRPAPLGQQSEPRAVDGHSAFDTGRRRFGQIAVTPPRDRRDTDRIDDGNVPIVPGGECLELPRYERSEPRLDRIRIERGNREHTPHSLRTSISATATQAGLSTTIW